MAGGSVERYFDAHWRECTIATVRDEIVGVAVRRGTLLDLVSVKPSLRSKGVGSTLMATIEGQAALDGKELRLEVWAVNERAVGFYQRRGFSVVGVVWDPVTGLEKLLMRKAL